MPRSQQNTRRLLRKRSTVRTKKPSKRPAPDAFSTALELHFGEALAAQGGMDARAAIAVSGGGDSTALMALYARTTQKRKTKPPVVLIVDHKLRKESTKEARFTAKCAEALGLTAHILTRRGTKPKANVEEAARIARYRLMADWCAKHKIATLYLAHTRDDQAETFLIRLGRGSGVDGLSAMQARASFPLAGEKGPELVRPLLDFGREELRRYLTARKISWIEDPSNSDPRFTRTRMRALLPQLAEAGITPERIAAAAAHLARARTALEAQTVVFLARHSRPADAFIALDGKGLAQAPREIALRALAQVLMDMAASPLRPRFERLQRLLGALYAPGFHGQTLLGCRISPAPKDKRVFGPSTVLVAREPARRVTKKVRKAP